MLDPLLDWLLDGDVAIQYQVHRDLLHEHRKDLQGRIAAEGWGARFLARRNANGHWGKGFYSPKWISSHYTLLDLKHLGIDPQLAPARDTIRRIRERHTGTDGGINPSVTIEQSDVCVNGMFLNYACYFGFPAPELHSIVDYLVSVRMPDGGFNCRSNRGGADHSSLHTTISILEGLLEYSRAGYTYRLEELDSIAAGAREFILQHCLFRSDKTGEIIDSRFLMLSYPSRWFYDILRALDYFRDAGIPYDPRMQDALNVLEKKRRSDGAWPVQSRHAGKIHFEMEKTGGPSRWNTLRALRVRAHFGVS